MIPTTGTGRATPRDGMRQFTPEPHQGSGTSKPGLDPRATKDDIGPRGNNIAAESNGTRFTVLTLHYHLFHPSRTEGCGAGVNCLSNSVRESNLSNLTACRKRDQWQLHPMSDASGVYPSAPYRESSTAFTISPTLFENSHGVGGISPSRTFLPSRSIHKEMLRRAI